MKFLASDLDGTLIKNHKISEKDLNAIKKLRENGHKFIVSTGRTPNGFNHVVNQYNFEYDYLVLCNGGMIFNKERELIHKKVITNEVKNNIINDFYGIEKLLMYYDDGNETYIIENKDESLSKKETDFLESFSNKVDLDTALNWNGTYSMMSLFDPDGSIELCEKIKDAILEKYGEYVDAFRNQCFIDIVPKGCSKGNALMMILEDEKQSTDNIYTIGDSFNDVSMFNITKNSYTFNEAEELVKPHANNIVDYVHEAINDILK